jgi:DNA-binding transcriptional regulator YiaG
MDGTEREAKEKIVRLKAIRKALGWSEEVCAYHLGVTYSTLNRWERGESLPRSRLVLKAIDRFIATHGIHGPKGG